MTVSLDLFAVFARVGESGSFTRAARELGVSKATVSKQVALLEKQLGVVLVARTTRKAALTEAGERVLRRAQRMVEERDAAKEEAGEARTVPQGRLKISAPVSFGVTYLSPLLGPFLTAYPNIQLDLSLEDRTVDLIGEGFDAALRIRAMEDSSLTARKITDIVVETLASPGYLAAHGEPGHPQDLAQHACLHYTNQASVWRFDGPGQQKAQVRVDGPFCTNNGELLVAAAVAGQGIIVIPRFLSWHQVQAGALRAIMPAWQPPRLALHLLSPPGRSMPQKLRAFSDFLFAHFGAGRAPWVSGALV